MKNYAEEIEKFLDSKRQEMIGCLCEFIRIPSVKGVPTESCPFGKEVKDGLNFIRAKASELGLIARTIDDVIVTAGVCEKQTSLGILCHTDVVGADPEKWKTPPFEPAISDGFAYGRGACDNKGPSVAALYAAYAVKALGIPLKNNVRIYFGSDEESGSGDFKKYLESNELPENIFVPDACFPVGVSETGRVVLEIRSNPRLRFVTGIKCGKDGNSVPDSAEIEIKGVTETVIEAAFAGVPSEVKTSAEARGDGKFTVTLTGVSTHPAHPQYGINAATAAIAFVSALEGDNKAFADLKRLFPHGVFFGEPFGLKPESSTLSVVTLALKNGGLYVETNSRFSPENTVAGIAAALISKLSAASFDVKAVKCAEAHCVTKDSPIVGTLQNIYYERTGSRDEPYDLDAMTYAHLKDNAVVFGGVLYGDGSGNAHGADERYNLDTLVAAAKIFAAAIVKICGKE